MSNDNWIPVEEKLPTTGAPRFVTLASSEVCTAYYVPSAGSWHYEQSGGVCKTVIAWQERPKPYQKPRRFVVREGANGLSIVDRHSNWFKAYEIPTREAAEIIANAYEEAYRGE